MHGCFVTTLNIYIGYFTYHIISTSKKYDTNSQGLALHKIHDNTNCTWPKNSFWNSLCYRDVDRQQYIVQPRDNMQINTVISVFINPQLYFVYFVDQINNL